MTVLFFAAAGMELSWLFAAAALLLALFGGSYLSLPHALAAFFLGALLTLYMQKQKWRIITRLAVQILFFSMVVLHSLYASAYRWGSFVDEQWLGEFFRGSYATTEGLLWLTAVFVAVLFWSGGVFLARRSLSYYTLTIRFDVGIAAFLLILIVSGVTNILVRPIMLLLFPFFLFSMPAIALAHNRQGDAQGVFLQKYRGSGPVITFTVAVILGGSAVLLLFYPLLTQAAEAGYAALQYYGPSLTDFLGRLILILFGYGARLRRNAPAPSTEESFLLEPMVAEEGEAGFWELLISYGSIVILGLLFLFISGWFLWRLCLWLWSGKEKPGVRRSLGETLLYYLQRCRYLLQRASSGLRHFVSCLLSKKTEPDAAHFFANLLAWGCRSGFARFAAETPREYGLLLGQSFPAVQREIEIVVNCYHEEIYGEANLNVGQKEQLRRAWRILCSPRYWPLRLYNRFLWYGGRRVGEWQGY